MEQAFWNPLHFLEKLFDRNQELLQNNEFNQPANTILVKKLDWDSEFFNADIFKLEFIPDIQDLPATIEEVISLSLATNRWNVFAEVPSEEIHCFSKLTSWGFQLVETRFTYYHTLDKIQEENVCVREAGILDIPSLKATASGAVNLFDKYHADPFFSIEDANRYLETYIENCVNGFAEKVFVPDLPAPSSFVALGRIQYPGFDVFPLYRIPLTACLPANKGMHYHLCLHALLYAKSQSAKCLVMTTQSTNKAVIHNCEKLGFKFGSCTHLFSKSSN